MLRFVYPQYFLSVNKYNSEKLWRRMIVSIQIRRLIAIAFFVGLGSSQVIADDVTIIGADFQQSSDGSWLVNVGLLHEDSGWDHYADIWRLVDAEGNVLGERVLLHPHEDEQPFIRSEQIRIPADLEIIYVEAHDIVHGWTPNRLEIDMTKVENGRLTVTLE